MRPKINCITSLQVRLSWEGPLPHTEKGRFCVPCVFSTALQSQLLPTVWVQGKINSDCCPNYARASWNGKCILTDFTILGCSFMSHNLFCHHTCRQIGNNTKAKEPLGRWQKTVRADRGLQRNATWINHSSPEEWQYDPVHSAINTGIQSNRA